MLTWKCRSGLPLNTCLHYHEEWHRDLSDKWRSTFGKIVRPSFTPSLQNHRFYVWKTSVCQWNLDSGFQSFVGFRIPWGIFPIPKPRMPDFTGKNFLDSGIRVLYHRAKNTSPYTEERRKNKIIDIPFGKLSTKRRLNTFQHSTKSIFNMRCRVGQLFAMHSFHF